MPFFGEDFLKSFGSGFFGADGLKDYEHAAKTFLTNGYELSPRFKFLYHVFFNINTGQIPQLAAIYGSGEIASIGLMVKSVQLPSFQMNTEVMNQYNRKRVVQTKIQYQPIDVVFHDDQGDLIRNMWYNYYSYYYKDPSQKYEAQATTSGTIGNLQTLSNGFNYNTNDIYESSRQVSDWGYIGESYSDGTAACYANTGKPPFFKDIKIFGLSQKKFASYVLINPLITSWQHDTYAYADGGGTMENTMNVEYETVKYYGGYIGRNSPSNVVPGFADPAHYDLYPSALSRPGSTATVFGQGGLVDAAIGSVEDLEMFASGEGGLWSIIGAVQKAGTAYNTFKNKNIGQIAVADAKTAAIQIARYNLPGYVREAVNATNGFIFPSANSNGLLPQSSINTSGYFPNNRGYYF